ncbi:hypothetical protein ACWD4P_38395, partial [Kitasatospora sp. NPDC002543]
AGWSTPRPSPGVSGESGESGESGVGTFRIHLFFILVFAASMTASFVYGHAHPAMLTWASFALLITASPIFAWRWTMRQDRKKPKPPAAPPDQGEHLAAPAHAAQEKPSWAAPDQTMQIALGGRKK